MPLPYSNLSVFAPEISLCALGLFVLAIDLVVTGTGAGRASRSARGRRLVPAVTMLGLLGCFTLVLSQWGNAPTTEFQGAVAVDSLALLFKLVFIACGILIAVLAADFFGREESPGELFSFIVLLVLGMCLLAGANDLVLLYLAFELVSLTAYLLVAWRKHDRLSAEAGMKYFIYGAAASGVMLYGLSLLYGAGGATNLIVIARHLMAPTPYAGLALPTVLGAILLTVGLGYKISMAPFHSWAPDVYEGAPTPVTALLSVGPKAAGFAALFRVFYALAPALHVPWQMVFAVLAVVTMFAGNLLALRQTNVKRMLAYSSIAHAGYLLIGFVVGPQESWGVSGVMVYLVAYLLMNVGLFGVAILLEQATGSSEIERFRGLARGAPGLAAMTVILLLSLTGIPPTAGFLGKFLIFAAAIKSHQWAWLAVIGIMNSVISLYYYMNLARLMYFAGGESPRPQPWSALAMGTVVVTTAATVVVFVAPGWLLEAARLTALVP